MISINTPSAINPYRSLNQHIPKLDGFFSAPFARSPFFECFSMCCLKLPLFEYEDSQIEHVKVPDSRSKHLLVSIVSTVSTVTYYVIHIFVPNS